MLQSTGYIVAFMETQEGKSANGHWMRGGLVIETGDEYPRKVAFTAFGEEKVQELNNHAIGDTVTVSFRPESREYDGRWYTELKIIKVANLTRQPR